VDVYVVVSSANPVWLIVTAPDRTDAVGWTAAAVQMAWAIPEPERVKKTALAIVRADRVAGQRGRDACR
jgi:hypothetical protein